MENEHGIPMIQKIHLHMTLDALLCPCEESPEHLQRTEETWELDCPGKTARPEKQNYSQDGGEKFY